MSRSLPRLPRLLGIAAMAAAPVSAATIGDTLARASVRVGAGCTGVLVERSQLVATAHHCVNDVDATEVRLSDGTQHTAWVVGIDEASDQAVLFIPESVAVPPLAIVQQRPIVGTMLYFAGRPDRHRVREVRLDRVGRCDSLPALDAALFTSVDGVPGDSGAPLVDLAGRIVGLVHGGARCHIATPASTLRALVHDVLRPES